MTTGQTKRERQSEFVVLPFNELGSSELYFIVENNIMLHGYISITWVVAMILSTLTLFYCVFLTT